MRWGEIRFNGLRRDDRPQPPDMRPAVKRGGARGVGGFCSVWCRYGGR